MAVPYTFGSATTSIPLSQLDSNFATTITLGNTAIQLGNTVTTLNNMTLPNATIASGNISASILTSGTIPSARQPVGSILQVVQYVLYSSNSTASSTDLDTGLTVSITPSSSSSKVLIFLSAMLRATNTVPGNCYIYLKLWRGAIGSGTLLFDGYPVVGAYVQEVRGVANQTIIDTPATTSAVTYRVSINSAYANTVYINSGTNPSTITVMEIAA